MGQIAFYCVFERKCCQDYKTGDMVFYVKTGDLSVPKNQYGCTKCKGNLTFYGRKMPLYITGRLDGDTVTAETIEKKYNEETSITEYLSGLVDGLGKTSAERIVKATGKDFFQIIRSGQAENILLSIKGINQEKIRKLVDICKKDYDFQEAYQFILSNGGSYHDTLKVYKKWRDKTVQKLRENPYRAVEECGMPFSIVENIAKKEGIPYHSDERIRLLAEEAMKRQNAKGHTYSSIKEIVEEVRRLEADSSYHEEKISPIHLLSVMSEMENVTIERDRLFQKKIYDAEVNICNQLKRLDVRTVQFELKEEYIQYAQDKRNIVIVDKQKECFNLLKSNGIKIITGGAGTGKTTIEGAVIDAYKMMQPNGVICLCAPTGRASQRMTEATGMEACTIHKLLEFAPYGNNAPNRDRNHPLDADLIIVDECSMVDTLLFSYLLNAVKSGAIVVLVGDENQIKPVGTGMVFHDLIHSGRFETYRITSVYRQKGGKGTIIENSNRILKGDCGLVQDSHFVIKRVENQEEIRRYIVNGFQKQNIKKVQALSPMKKYGAGTASINRALQEKMIDKKQGIVYGDNHFYIGDKVILVRNNYEQGYFNGDMGEITEITDCSIKVKTYSDTFEVPKENYDEIELAYSITIHKAQGSESKSVVIALPKCGMLKRSLLYTSVTRAKENVYIISEGDALEMAVLTDDNQERHTNLLNLLRDAMIDKKMKEV